MAFLSLALLAAFIVSMITVRHLITFQPSEDLHLFFPRPPLLAETSKFPCLDSQRGLKSKGRFAPLLGPDWKIKSAINPGCLPERELVFTTEEGEHFLPHAVVRNVRFWVTRRGDLIYVKILDGSVSEQTDASALDLITNHKCKNKKSQNCSVQSTSLYPLIRID